VATWRELSLDSVEAARKLLVEGHWRSSVNRAYYAAYSAVSDQLVRRGARFANGWNNQTHDQVSALIRSGLALPLSARRDLGRAVRRLRTARETADYRPGLEVDRSLALACIRDATLIIQTLERVR